MIALTGLGVDVGRTPVLRALDLLVRAGEVYGILGHNGAGKSTLLRVLATLLHPACGQGTVLGARLGSSEVRRVRASIALVGHRPAAHPHLTLEENLRHVAALTGRPESAVMAALEVVGLRRAAGRRADRCSQGMLRRADLARIVVTEPALLLLDEPHAGLDRASFGLVDLVVQRVRARGGASVVVSHDAPRIWALADRVGELADGGILARHRQPEPESEWQ
ncbi:heme exporter protein A [Amycolatopsis saalfeldensis]|uniref:Heme exporter protein A n=1 Tax=Amycolatopsis saalfeldensis TaxID=394193 RepID=A0A1H8YNB8_9PSEU|nr:heme exporter protein A [Amycolatopsis saalfeldensis]